MCSKTNSCFFTYFRLSSWRFLMINLPLWLYKYTILRIKMLLLIIFRINLESYYELGVGSVSTSKVKALPLEMVIFLSSHESFHTHCAAKKPQVSCPGTAIQSLCAVFIFFIDPIVSGAQRGLFRSRLFSLHYTRNLFQNRTKAVSKYRRTWPKYLTLTSQ